MYDAPVKSSSIQTLASMRWILLHGHAHDLLHGLCRNILGTTGPHVDGDAVYHCRVLAIRLALFSSTDIASVRVGVVMQVESLVW
jgi:hypothetical protein